MALAVGGALVASWAAEGEGVRRPAGFLRMDVVGLTDTDRGPTLFLTDAAHEVLVPVPLDESRRDEAYEDGAAGLDMLGELRETRIDRTGGVWIVTLVMEDGGGRHEITAPASSLSIADAQREAPVWLSRKALDEAGLWRNPRRRVSLGRDLRDGQRELATEQGI